MPDTTHERPPDSGGRRRPPEGPTVPNQPSKHAALLADLATFQKALDDLSAAGSEAVEAARRVGAYAEQQAKHGLKVSASRSASTHSLRVTKAFREHIYTQKAPEGEDAGAQLNRIAKESLQDFTNGDWIPAAPGRARRGSNLGKVPMSVWVPKDVWDAANEKGQDPAQVAARGYKLTAAAVVIAAYIERFGLPESEQGDTEA